MNNYLKLKKMLYLIKATGGIPGPPSGYMPLPFLKIQIASHVNSLLNKDSFDFFLISFDFYIKQRSEAVF